MIRIKKARGSHVVATWIRQHKRLAIVFIILLVLLLAGGGAAAYYFLTKKSDQPTPSKPGTPKVVTPEPVKYYSPLTGNEVQSKDVTETAVTGIMIENSPDARPQSGLKDSGVVFEAIAEGGITRFLVLYQEQKPQLIGPVRSVRLYYVDWVAPFNASIAHIGGSYYALQEVRNGNYRDIDQFFNSGAYWRASDRYAPHNVYTSFERLDALNRSKGYVTSNFKGFTRVDPKKKVPASAPAATQLNIAISGPTYNSSYVYNPESGTYDRSQAGAPHTDRELGQISPKVVIAMKVNMRMIFEDGWREQIDSVGSGQVFVFQNGTVVEGTWTKSARGEQIVFTDAEGKEIPLEAGQTWITAVPNGSGAVSWQ